MLPRWVKGFREKKRLAWFKGGTPPGFWTTTASVLLQVIEMKGDAKNTPLDQGVDHVDHPWHKDSGGPGMLVFIVHTPRMHINGRAV